MIDVRGTCNTSNEYDSNKDGYGVIINVDDDKKRS